MTAMRDGPSTSVGVRSQPQYSTRDPSLSIPTSPSRSSSTSSGSSRRSGPSHGGSPTHSQVPSSSTLPPSSSRYQSIQPFGGRPPQPTNGAGYAGDYSQSGGSRANPQFDAYGRYNPSLDAMRFR
ncbi:hypothetical protein BV22DRAFT_1129090 [Leucogyrophana mollusca]|uniref:Uncharacterized protein n=1 Tax=Leucogyrophana mollusca TaxID=85980 RepID=A0ACB8BKH7_9AGAM|nr:hypothetical protein BV22DRAFT_1129090 [Leucogyrophana mollusca]